MQTKLAKILEALVANGESYQKQIKVNRTVHYWV